MHTGRINDFLNSLMHIAAVEYVLGQSGSRARWICSYAPRRGLRAQASSNAQNESRRSGSLFQLGTL